MNAGELGCLSAERYLFSSSSISLSQTKQLISSIEGSWLWGGAQLRDEMEDKLIQLIREKTIEG